jgi:hypothetical protein
MPYIKPEDRRRLDPLIGPLAAEIRTEGEANYTITRILDTLYNRPPSYRALNTAMGVLACVQAELYRRVAAPYEDKKMAESGDVYGERATSTAQAREGYRE